MRSRINNPLRLTIVTFGLALIFISLPQILTLSQTNAVASGLIVPLVFVFFATLFWLMIHIYFWITETGKRNQHVQLDSYDNPIPKHMINMAQEIENLGFTKIGVKTLQDNQSAAPYRCWLWVDDTQTVVAFLVEHVANQPFAYFYTRYADGFTLETSWNFGFSVNGSAIMLNKVEHSINEAYHLHIRLQDEQASKHGKYKTFDSVESTHPDQKHHKNAMRQIFESKMQEITIQLVMWGIVFFGLLLYRRWLPIDAPIEFVVILVASFSFVMVIKSQFMSKQSVRKSARKSV